MVTCRRCGVDERLPGSLHYVPFRVHNKNTEERKKKKKKKEKQQLICVAYDKNNEHMWDAKNEVSMS